MQEHELSALVGMTARALDGEKIGTVEEALVEEHSQETAWVRIRGGLLGRRHALAPVAEARVEAGDLVLAHDKDTVVHAPYLPEWPPSFDDAQSLYQHYATAWMSGQRGTEGASHVAGAAYNRPDPADGIADPASLAARTGARGGSDALGEPTVADGPRRYDELIEPRDQADGSGSRGERDE